MKRVVNENIKKVREAIENNKLVVFVGSGVSINSNYPSWSEMINEFSDAMGMSANKEFSYDDYLRIAQYYYNERGAKEYYDSIDKKFNVKVSYNKIHEKILEMNPVHIITTNYDDLIEQSIEDSHMVYDVVCEDADLPYTPNGHLLIKMHGDLKRKNIVLKEDDYLLYSQRFKLIETFIKSLFVNHVVLFVGYSLQDMDLKLIIKWVKDILGEHFQRAYFLDVDENRKNAVEENYFKNMGINIIGINDIDTEYQKLQFDEIQNEKGKNLIRCINYILKYENNDADVIDYFYNRLSVFKDMNRLRINDVIDTMGIKLNITFKENHIELFADDDSKTFEVLIKEFINLDALEDKSKSMEYIKKAEYIKTIFLNANILGICIRHRDDKDVEYVFNYQLQSKELEILNLLKANNYIEIENYCNQTYKPINDHKNSYFNEIIRAYSNYLMHRYLTAYEILKKISKEAYRNNEYIAYYICEFKKKHLVRAMDYAFSMGENYYPEHLEKIKKEFGEDCKKMDLRQLYYMLPKNERLAVNCINDVIINESYFGDKKAKIGELKKKVEEENSTIFFGGVPNGTFAIKREVHEFWEYTHNYFLMVDNYSDIKNYYFTYISTLMTTYCKDKENILKEDNLIFPIEFSYIVPEYKFDNLDLYIMYRYINNDNLINLFKENNIDKIYTEIPNILFIGQLCNVIHSYLHLEYTRHILNQICNMIILCSKLQFTEDEMNKVYQYLNELIQKDFVSKEIYKALDYFCVNNFKQNIVSTEFINNLCVKFLEKLINNKNNGNKGGHELDTIETTSYFANLSYILEENDGKLDADELIAKVLFSINHSELMGHKNVIIMKVLIPTYKLVSNEKKKEIVNFINENLERNFNVEIYVEASINDIIKVNNDYELLINKLINSLIEKKEYTKEITTPDPVITNLRYIVKLVYKGKLINMELFLAFKGIDNLFDFIIEPNTFDYDKFDTSWLTGLNDEYLNELTKNDNARTKIKNKLKNDIIANDVDKVLKEIYFKYFE